MLDPERWQGYYREVGEALGHPFVLGSDRSPFMDTYAMQALWHMGAHGTTERQIAAVAAKSHNNGALNPKAQYRFPMTIEEVLADRAVTTPFTRAMCSPIGDGAAAVLVASESFVGALSGSQRMRSIAIRSSVLRTGTYRPPEALGVVAKAAAAALAEAGLTPDDIDVAEVHDATAFSEISKAEAIGFCPEGAGGPLAESGATGLNGRIPLNPSGGLVSKGHPVGATGLAMLSEIVEQLRGEAGGGPGGGGGGGGGGWRGGGGGGGVGLMRLSRPCQSWNGFVKSGDTFCSNGLQDLGSLVRRYRKTKTGE
jgi:acetyl-CoA acetyltransferase